MKIEVEWAQRKIRSSRAVICCGWEEEVKPEKVAVIGAEFSKEAEWYAVEGGGFWGIEVRPAPIQLLSLGSASLDSHDHQWLIRSLALMNNNNKRKVEGSPAESSDNDSKRTRLDSQELSDEELARRLAIELNGENALELIQQHEQKIEELKKDEALAKLVQVGAIKPSLSSAALPSSKSELGSASSSALKYPQLKPAGVNGSFKNSSEHAISKKSEISMPGSFPKGASINGNDGLHRERAPGSVKKSQGVLQQFWKNTTGFNSESSNSKHSDNQPSQKQKPFVIPSNLKNSISYRDSASTNHSPTSSHTSRLDKMSSTSPFFSSSRKYNSNPSPFASFADSNSATLAIPKVEHPTVVLDDDSSGKFNSNPSPFATFAESHSGNLAIPKAESPTVVLDGDSDSTTTFSIIDLTTSGSASPNESDVIDLTSNPSSHPLTQDTLKRNPFAIPSISNAIDASLPMFMHHREHPMPGPSSSSSSLHYRSQDYYEREYWSDSSDVEEIKYRSGEDVYEIPAFHSPHFKTERWGGGWGGGYTLGTSEYRAEMYAPPIRLTRHEVDAELKKLLEQANFDEELDAADRTGVPDGLIPPLLEHQKVGLAWMVKKEETNNLKGGILADDMGLGKTIQSMALILARPPPEDSPHVTLVVTAVSLVRQWELEFSSKIQPGKLRVGVHYGPKRTKNPADLRRYDVVITSYSVVQMETPIYKPNEKGERVMVRGPGTLAKVKFFRIILDEAQQIKNRNTRSAKGCYELEAEHRWCLSATPLQNNLEELFSLFHFLRIRPMCEWDNFRTQILQPMKSRREKVAFTRVQAVLKTMLLRRRKSDKINGKPILVLPTKEVTLQQDEFTPEERDFYDSLEKQSRLNFEKYVKAGTVMRNYTNILLLLLRLRQAVLHPHLVPEDECVVPAGLLDGHHASGMDGEALEERRRQLVQNMDKEVVRRLISQLEESLECPICMDAAQNGHFLPKCGHIFCRECILDYFNTAFSSGEPEKTCPSCRGHLDIDTIASIELFKSIHVVPQAEAESESLSELNELHLKANGLDEAGPSKLDNADEDDVSTTDDDFAGPSTTRGPSTNTKVKKEEKGKAVDKGKGRARGRTKSRAMGQNTLEKFGFSGEVNSSEPEFPSSTKIDKLLETLDKWRSEAPEDKTIVFSQFTGFLDILEEPLLRHGYKFARYDGTMSVDERSESVARFSISKDVNVMLVSMKCGSLGLNLCCANRVIIMDLWWNPALEHQAIDRVHRIGQHKNVTVTRLTIANTVEERILKLQEKKQMIFDGALGEGKGKKITRLSLNDLLYLFRGDERYLQAGNAEEVEGVEEEEED
ncbi:uncharacterized protein VTP21DRAFT_11115 [Calcarisporiella thermophila]|uniref:uncharacterized protein n=1 Tax=Calcarisporiella thermophila TaxID=911321 RepID=UPI0037437019